ncbi:MAG: trehalose-phosphatase [Terriglobia bacterium]
MAAPLAGAARTEWARRLQRAPALALFSDFDGTLSRIVPRATQASLPTSTRKLLRQLARRRDVFDAIVSGRPVRDRNRTRPDSDVSNAGLSLRR